ncbi:hypothetical protein [Subtercola boreus]|uniref:hypothetical protein n=1 Tax=Subtercola boreus TaxID=120213 RepID=UPI0011C01B67|nr:hypothetical protein [Subtercola boreus]
MNKAGQFGTLELEIKIGTRTVLITVGANEFGWQTGLEEHFDNKLRFEGEPTIVTVPGSTANSGAAVIRAIYRPE